MAVALLVAALLQGDALEEARRDLGPSFACSAIERTLVFASTSAGEELAGQKRSVAGSPRR